VHLVVVVCVCVRACVHVCLRACVRRSVAEYHGVCVCMYRCLLCARLCTRLQRTVSEGSRGCAEGGPRVGVTVWFHEEEVNTAPSPAAPPSGESVLLSVRGSSNNTHTG